jgi:hypothetical protein
MTAWRNVDVASLPADVRARIVDAGPQQAHKLGRAKPTTVDNIRFPSATQARVYQRLKLELREGQKMTLDTNMPVVATAPTIGRKTPHVRIDFVIWTCVGVLRHSGGTCEPLSYWRIFRFIDAKPRNREARSRDWHRGKLALEATYGIKVEEVDA